MAIVVHAHIMYTRYFSGEFDYSGTQMVLTMKISSFAYNIYDGTTDREEIFQDTISDTKKLKVYKERRRYAILELPSLLEYFGYIFCFTCILAGPAFEYRDYVDCIDQSVFVRKISGHEKNIQVPSSFLPAIKTLMVAVACLCIHFYLSSHFTSAQLCNLSWISTWEWYYRVPYFWMTEVMERFKYYFVWKVFYSEKH